jgi:thioredoxin-related protein
MKRFFLALSAAALLAGATLAPAGGELPAAADLQADAEQAARARVPLLVFFSAYSCPYCREVEELYLQPLQADPASARRVLIRTVLIDSHRRLYDFDGRRTDHAGLARNYGVFFTPTIKLLDPQGRELAPALVGLTTRDYYGGYLEEAIERALARLRG